MNIPRCTTFRSRGIDVGHRPYSAGSKSRLLEFARAGYLEAVAFVEFVDV